jgi:CBS domain containing-hemolysin-like protein
VTILLLIFGEIFPKTLATRYADKISLSVAHIYKFLQIILFPVIRCIEKLMKALQKKKVENKVTDEEIEAFIDK